MNLSELNFIKSLNGDVIDIDKTEMQIMVWHSEHEKEEVKKVINLLSVTPELLEACESAMRIVDLWAPSYSNEEIKECDISEIAALAMMRQTFEKVIKKATS